MIAATVKNPPPSSRYITQAAYARLKNWDKSRVSRLKEAGLLVLTDDGLVDIGASDSLIADNRSPAHQGVAEYHAQKRADTAANPKNGGQPGQNPEHAALGLDIGHKAITIRTATEYERLKAAKRDNELAEGKLVPTDQVEMAIYDAVVTFRTGIELLPDQLADQFSAETDRDKIHRQDIWIDNKKVQRTVYYPPKTKDRPLSDTLISFLTDCRAEFLEGIKAFRNGNYD